MQADDAQTIDVKAIRKKTGLTQEQFCAAYHISPSTLRNWEQKKRDPDGAAITLLRVIDAIPYFVREVLSKPRP